MIGLIKSTQNNLITTEELLDIFAEFIHIDVGAGDAANDTIKTYCRQIKQFVNWCKLSKINPIEVTQQDIKSYRHWMIKQKKFKPSTIALKLSVVKRFYQAALERGLISFNPATGIKAPREKRDRAEKITYLEKSEVEKLLSTIPRNQTIKSLRDQTIIAIMALEGTRTIELYRANIEDIVKQGNNLGIRVEGKRQIRVVPVTSEIAKILISYLDARQQAGEKLKPNTPLFICTGNRAKNQRLSRRGIRFIIDQYLHQADLKYSPGRTISAHSLRHTAGTLALHSGAQLRQVQDLLGHADPRTTCIYAHIADRWENNPALKVGINLDSITETSKD